MSFKLQNLNVIRIVETEAQKQRLIAQGFKDITLKPKEEKPPEEPANTAPPADDKAKQGKK
ncbi:MAG: hypothetical protein LKE46_00190 [Clostridium sp.]|jgi:hypothetical protein|uniref:hypothetical protein n=1 Tax=Clostridium sp. TaxID=1506 RepID=UPI0025BC86EF|nr:hypothetical protein [Clostridium sp.]MCH3962686.1 hypothetical protein [Clostridium sp.]MCI2201071.1 hypothetical protein [Clostridium sp.]